MVGLLLLNACNLSGPIYGEDFYLHIPFLHKREREREREREEIPEKECQRKKMRKRNSEEEIQDAD